MTESQIWTQLNRLGERFKMWVSPDWVRSVRESHCSQGYLRSVVDSLCSGTGEKPQLSDLLRKLQPYRDSEPSPGVTFDPQSGERLYRCPKCRDTGMMYVIVHVSTYGTDCLSMSECSRCETGKTLSARRRETGVLHVSCNILREFDTYDQGIQWSISQCPSHPVEREVIMESEKNTGPLPESRVVESGVEGHRTTSVNVVDVSESQQGSPVQDVVSEELPF